MTVYFISGLGADERMFQKLMLPAHWNIRHLAWLPPQHKEPLAAYSKRMAQSINTSEEFVLVGLSFGGMIAVEMSRLVSPKLIVLLSSVSTRRELPSSFKWLGKLQINKLVPSFLFNRIYPFTYWFAGVKKREDKRALRDVITGTSPRLFKWSVNKILNWKNEIRPNHLVHIHGTADRIFPIGKTKADIKVAGGGHLMVYTMPEEISPILIEAIESHQ